MRGEDAQQPYSPVIGCGSPPHARGRLLVDEPFVAGDGITPACAGKTPLERPPQWRRQDHPRMRGEDSNLRRLRATISGSPPHARGRLSIVAKAMKTVRITPACAGKTPNGPDHSCSRTDHPRMRGEDCTTARRGTLRAGSPPHARGRHLLHDDLPLLVRITPACAGKTYEARRLRLPLRITPACAGKTVRLPRESDKIVFQLTSFPSLPT